jgi:hypothetical protein
MIIRDGRFMMIENYPLTETLSEVEEYLDFYNKRKRQGQPPTEQKEEPKVDGPVPEIVPVPENQEE